VKLQTSRTAKLATAKKLSASLYDFMRAAWSIVVPNAPFVDNWHIGAICEHLQAQSQGQLSRLVINVPPGSSKSTTVCVMWPAWEWTFNPGIQWQFAAYADALAVRDSLRCRSLTESHWYQQMFGEVWRPKHGRWMSGLFENTSGGIREAVSVGGSATGFHAHRQVVDDPIKAADAHSPAALEKARMWWFETMASRVLPGNNTRTVIMQRLSDKDLAGVAKEQGYTTLTIPMAFVAKRRFVTPIGWTDPRTNDGELLCPERWDDAEVAKRKKEFGPDGWGAQDQQDPVPEGGSIYKDTWLSNFYTALPDLSDAEVILSIDCAFKELDSSSYVALQAWAYKPPNAYLLDEIHDHLDFLGTVAAAKTLHARWAERVAISAILVEDKANGPAVINVLSKELSGVLAIEPDGSKIARAYATQPWFAAQNIWLPDPSIAPWVWDWITEHKRFPRGKEDDRVDAQTQGIRHFQRSGTAEYLDALRQA
jgi:predicted phage terminase large subunit-like protein